MSIINISGTTPVDDPNYRYKMPMVVSKIEGKGNGIKSVIVNISDLALALHRDPGEVNKYFGCEIGAQTTYNEKDDKAIVNGAHTTSLLQKSIHKYIEAFVLCPNCRLPETDYKIKNGCINHRCKACGTKEMVDMGHKLCTYILAQHKKKMSEEKKAGKKKGKEKETEEEKKKSKKDKKKKDKKKKDKKEKKSSDDDVPDDEDKSVDTEEGVDDAGAMLLAVEGVQNFLKANPDSNESEIIDSVKNQQMSSALKSHERIHLFMNSVITPDFFKKDEIKRYASIIRKITNGGIEMQRHLISSVEGLCVQQIVPKFFPVILKQLFDEDLLDEDVILEWAFDGRSEYTPQSVDEDVRATLRGNAEQVVAWLQEDSDDSDSDDE